MSSPGSSGGSLEQEPVNEQMIIGMYNNIRSEINQLHSKITELEMEVSEHSLVIGAVESLDPSRRCYRMIGGVLVERTVREVIPAVQRNKEGLEEVISRLYEALERKKKELQEFEVKHKIKIRRSDAGKKEDEGTSKEASSAAAQGVLVGPAGVWPSKVNLLVYTKNYLLSHISGTIFLGFLKLIPFDERMPFGCRMWTCQWMPLLKFNILLIDHVTLFLALVLVSAIPWFL